MTQTQTTFKRIFATIILSAFIFASCKKDSSGGSSDNLASGGASIQFNTSSSFGGKNEFKSNAKEQSKVIKVNNMSRTQITFTCVETNLPRLSTATLTLIVAQGSSTISGAISGKFENGASAATQGQLLIGSSNAGSGAESYASSTGNFTITKLTDSEIEGTFDAACINNTTKTNISLSSGKFAGKF
ncbi:hypothetical protein [Niabella hibiscisoli]|uniref:hypothetical protein n=1 Tax=Niabella hibiscisoli TaxID=1825928 RepID=UPI001F0CE9E0|nr:hypothetical protein [Niabella hibiscisoli]MCH5715388.1 hypothetical protein [Niabella hibiscisoli]